MKRLPNRMTLKEAKSFFHEVTPILRIDRPQIVFDLSQVRQMDAAGIDILLRCMADAMKHDGDVKLAAISPQAAVVLELTRTDRLFEIYNNSTEAARSFSGFLPNAMRAAKEAAMSGEEPPAVAA